MRRFLWVALTLGLLTGADGPKTEDGKKTIDSLQGTWTMVSLVIDGEIVTEERVKTGNLVIDGMEYRPELGANAVCATLKVDPTKSPMAIDFSFTAGTNKGKDAKGIFKLENDVLTICRGAADGEDRPKEFTAPNDSGRLLVVWKRSKSAEGGQATAVSAERRRLKGSWQVLSYRFDGKDTPADELTEAFSIYDAEGVVTVQNKGEVIFRGKTAIDPSKTLKTIDLTFTEGARKGETALGIYEMDGDNLRVCRASPGAPRPTKYSSDAGSGHALMTYRRGGAVPRTSPANDQARQTNGPEVHAAQ
jgi:uncharacterized protein (TIGR03067 family)